MRILPSGSVPMLPKLPRSFPFWPDWAGMGAFTLYLGRLGAMRGDTIVVGCLRTSRTSGYQPPIYGSDKFFQGLFFNSERLVFIGRAGLPNRGLDRGGFVRCLVQFLVRWCTFFTVL